MNDLQKLNHLTKDLIILYIEDESILRENTYKMLKNLFKHIDTAQNGKEGWEKYQKYHNENDTYYDLVITDIKMPIMDGLTLSRKILQLHKKQLIVITSAHDESKYLIQFINMNINKFIIKPFNLNIITTQFLDLLEDDAQKSANILIDKNNYWNPKMKKFFSNNEEVKLSYNEITILDLLINNKNKIFSNDELLCMISTSSISYELTENTIKSAIKRLRKKLPQNTISNIYGQGYTIS